MNITHHHFHATVFSSFYPAGRSRILSTRQSALKTSPSLVVFIFYTFNHGVFCMARNVNGWAKSYHADNLLALKGDLKAMGMLSLLGSLANFADGDKVLCGQLLTSRMELALLSGESIKGIRRVLAKLVSTGLIDKCRDGARNSSTAGLLISVKKLMAVMNTEGLTNGTQTAPIIRTKELRIKEEREVLDYKSYNGKPRQAEVPPTAAESTPSFLNQFQNQESGSQIETAHISENDKNRPPVLSQSQPDERCAKDKNVDLNTTPAVSSQADPLRKENVANLTDYQPPEAVALNRRWREFSTTVAETTHYDFLVNVRAIKTLVDGGQSYSELGKILDWLAGHQNAKISGEFIQPKYAQNSFFGGKTLLDTVVAEIKKELAKPPSIKDQVLRQDAARAQLNEKRRLTAEKISANFQKQLGDGTELRRWREQEKERIALERQQTKV